MYVKCRGIQKWKLRPVVIMQTYVKGAGKAQQVRKRQNAVMSAEDMRRKCKGRSRTMIDEN